MKTKYTKEMLEPVVMQCTSMRQVLPKLGLLYSGSMHMHIKKLVQMYGIDTSHFCTTSGKRQFSEPIKPEEYLINNPEVFRPPLRIKTYLLRDGIKEWKCEKCGGVEWNSIPIPIQLHHKDGDIHNNTLENLELLCANCHAQTDNYAGRKSSAQNKCKRCGKNIPNSREFCSKSCANKTREYPDRYKVAHPSKQQLKKDMESMSWLAIGRKYGVSDNAVRKWARKYDLL